MVKITKCSHCTYNLGIGSSKCYTCEYYPDLLELTNTKLCPMCSGKTVWFEGEDDYTQVYVCPKVRDETYHHQSDECINSQIKEKQNEILIGRVSIN